jgi:hypothetical protein
MGLVGNDVELDTATAGDLARAPAAKVKAEGTSDAARVASGGARLTIRTPPTLQEATLLIVDQLPRASTDFIAIQRRPTALSI